MTDIKRVYNSIAKDFDRTRYKIWPAVKTFIDQIKPYSINADIGCGNGKNMIYRSKDITFRGIDLSDELISICKNRCLDVIEGNIMSIPFEDNLYDNTLCIAVIHHLDNRNDRIMAIQELLRITKIGGQIIIYVWAFEQPIESKRKFNTQNEMVEYKTINGNIAYRYYHLYKKGELEEELNSVTLFNYKIIKSDYERGNWYMIIERIS